MAARASGVVPASAVVAAVPVAVLVLDAEHRVVEGNAAAASLLGRRAPAGLSGRHVCAVLSGCRRGAACPHPSCPAANGQLDAGRRTVVGTGTGRRARTLTAHSAALGAGVRLLTLRDRGAERAEARRDLLAMVVHDLRSPLTVVMSHADLLASGGEDFDSATRSEMAADILSSVLRLDRLINDLAVIGDADAGMLALDDVPIDLAAALRTTLSDDPAAPGLATALEGLPPVRGDLRAAGRALAGLVRNARNAVAGAAEPRLSARSDARWVTVTVSDDGPALPEPERAAALEPFGRLSGGRRSRRVTSLSAVVARVLAEAMGGTVGASDGVAGDGCAFWLRLPRA